MLPPSLARVISADERRNERTGTHAKSIGEWTVLHHLKDGAASRIAEGQFQKPLIMCAERDLREAECFHAASRLWRYDAWSPLCYDPDLLLLVTSIYVSQLLLENDQEIQACLATLEGVVSEDDLHQLLRFGRDLVAPKQSDQEAEAKEDELASELLERLWGGKSSTGVTFASLVDSVIRSAYFVTPPKRDAGPACATCLTFLRDQMEQHGSNEKLVAQLKELEEEVMSGYEKERVVLGKEDWKTFFDFSLTLSDEPGWEPLTALQARNLLELCKSSRLASCLFTGRPPNCVFSSHLLSVYECATHARLWLLKCQLPVYCHFKTLTYEVLGQDEELENKALGSVLGWLERIPSYVERLLRREAILQHCESLYGSQAPYPVCNVSVPLCSRLKVPSCIKKPEDAFRFESGSLDSGHSLALGLPIVLWHESKLGFWLGVDKVEDGSKKLVIPRPNHGLMKQYQDTSRFLEFLKARPSRPRPEGISFLA